MATAAQPSISIRVVLFARYAELAGGGEQTLQLPRGATIASVLHALRAQAGAVASGLPAHPLVARNHEHASLDTVLSDGDEVAVLPPLAGG